MHHPVFARFSDRIGFTADGYLRIRAFNPLEPLVEHAPLHEEYFEWISLLEAVETAQPDRFCMVELGAGFGRWGTYGGYVARSSDKKEITLIFVEAEPRHAATIMPHLRANGCDSLDVRIVGAAISYTASEVPFLIAAEGLDDQNWYGQSIFTHSAAETNRLYEGKHIYENGSLASIMVPAVRLEDVLADVNGVVDLIDSDLQGAEEDLVLRGIDCLNERVRRLHIGTHGQEIEAAIRFKLNSEGWRNVWDFPCGQTVETPFGSVAFGDGVQAWINPRL